MNAGRTLLNLVWTESNRNCKVKATCRHLIYSCKFVGGKDHVLRFFFNFSHHITPGH